MPPGDSETTPTLERSWEVIMKKVDEIDDEATEGWSDDINTLLVFAGLFSAVVTAFTVESYQWLKEDPQDATIVLLEQISQQLGGARNATIIGPQTKFIPSPVDVRINTFWFLSLILALVDALFALMCKRWLREGRRQANTRTPEQLLALRCFRIESFERWHVPSFLAALPILLEIALFLFLAGLLELLGTRHRTPFYVAVIVVGFATSVYLATTFLPALSIFHRALHVHPDSTSSDTYRMLQHLPGVNYLCPYKSPQAWAVFKLFSWVSAFPSFQTRLLSSLKRRFPECDPSSAYLTSLQRNIHRMNNWTSVDLNEVQRFSDIRFCPDVYQLKSTYWLVEEFCDIPIMFPHLRNVLWNIPPHFVMRTVFNQPVIDETSLRDWTSDDVIGFLSQCRSMLDEVPFQCSSSEIQMLYYHYFWISRGIYEDDLSSDKTTRAIAQMLAFNPPGVQVYGHRILAPFSRIAHAVELPGDAAVWLCSQYQQKWKEIPDFQDGFMDSFIHLFVSKISSTRRINARFSSRQGIEFLIFMHRVITKRAVGTQVTELFYMWLDALSRYRRFCSLAADRFDYHFGIPTGFLPMSVQRLGEIFQTDTEDDQRRAVARVKHAWGRGQHIQIMSHLHGQIVVLAPATDMEEEEYPWIYTKSFLRSPMTRDILQTMHNDLRRERPGLSGVHVRSWYSILRRTHWSEDWNFCSFDVPLRSTDTYNSVIGFYRRRRRLGLTESQEAEITIVYVDGGVSTCRSGVLVGRS